MQTVFIPVWLDLIVFHGLNFCSVLVSDDEIKKINQFKTKSSNPGLQKCETSILRENSTLEEYCCNV